MRIILTLLVFICKLYGIHIRILDIIINYIPFVTSVDMSRTQMSLNLTIQRGA